MAQGVPRTFGTKSGPSKGQNLGSLGATPKRVIQFFFWNFNAKMCQNSATFWRSNDFPGGSKFSRASEGYQNGGKTTRMDIPEFRDIKGPALMPKMAQSVESSTGV